MNHGQIANVIQVISSIENNGVDKIPETIFKDRDISTIKIGQYTLPDYIVDLKRMLEQLKIELSNNGIYLPFQYTFQNEFGNGTFHLVSELQNLSNFISQNNQAALNNSVPYLNRLIYYQIVNGFWDKSKTKVHDTDVIKVSELNKKLHIISNQLQLNQNNFNSQINNLNTEKSKLESFIKQKQLELQQITNNLQASNTNSNQINQLLARSTATNEQINSLLTKQKDSFKLQSKKIEEDNIYFSNQKKSFDTLESKLSNKIDLLEMQISSFNEKLDFVENKKEFFEERNTYLQNLIGREVGVSLFETFNQRKKELTKPVNKWLWIVVGMSLLTFFSIITIFTNGFGLWGLITKDFTAIQLISNTIKTFPFFFLLFYSISQYNKERNLQEEYAFKSAVALTINAYADIIIDEKLKDELIISSVSSIYKSPIIEKGRNKKYNNEILDTAKELLGTAIDIVKK